MHNDSLWQAPEMHGGVGMVALSKTWAKSQGLPSAQSWPWDYSKGIYLVNGFHTLHCVARLRQSVLQAYAGDDQTSSEHHLLHCLDVLREDIMCQADDSLRYTGRLHAQSEAIIPHSGIGQERMCRDWGKLRDWTQENSACYKPVNIEDPDFKVKDRYKYCPDGKVYWD